MRKKNLFMMVGTLFLLIAGLAGLLSTLVYHEPGFYQRASTAPGQARQEQSKDCLGRFAKLICNWVDGEKEWKVAFTGAMINSYFEEDFIRLGDAEALKKQGITDPRIVIEPDRIRLAFRYGSKPWSTVFSVDFKVWLVPNDVNVVALEILGRHFGSLPVSAQSLCEVLTDLGRQKNIEVNWYRHHNNPVALLRFQSDRTRPTAQLRRLQIDQDSITIAGRSLEPTPQVQKNFGLIPNAN